MIFRRFTPSAVALLFTLAFSSTFSGTITSAEPAPACTPSTPVGATCRAPMTALAPSQPNVGLRQVRDQVRELKEKSRDELEKYLKKKPAPVVRGPTGRYHLLDRHHLTRTLAELGATEFLVQIQQDWSKLATAAFWKKMTDARWVWLRTAQGHPLQPHQLPREVTHMGDDPYRSLAGAVQNADGFDKVDVYFLEFYWALFFRKHLPHLDLSSDSGFKAAVQKGLQLARSSLASGMPGYRPKENTAPATLAL